MLLHSLHSRRWFFYCQRLLDDAIEVVPTDICVTTLRFLGVPKGVYGVIVSYHTLLIVLPRNQLSPPLYRYLMDLYFPLLVFVVQ